MPMTTDEAMVTLGLDRGATREDVLAAHRELTQMMHPDKYGSNKRLRTRAERQMARINAARDELLSGNSFACFQNGASAGLSFKKCVR